MNIVKASLYFILLEFMTVFIWFVLVVHLKDIINILVTAVSGVAPEAVTVGQNVVTALNVLFVFLMIAWIGWYAYMAHVLTYETTYQILNQNQIRRF